MKLVINIIKFALVICMVCWLRRRCRFLLGINMKRLIFSDLVAWAPVAKRP